MVTYPDMLNYFKKDAKFSPECGLGMLTSSDKGSPANSENSKSKLIFALTATIGLRFVTSDKEDVIRIGYTPFYIPTKNRYVNFGGISFGIRF